MTKSETNNKKKVNEINNDKKESIKEIYKDETTKSEEITKKGKTKKIAQRIFDIVFWVVIIALAAIWLTDFFKVQNEKEPIFCLSEKTHEFEDGTVYECTGLGYKVYKYDRESINITSQFSPFFVGMKE